MNRPSRRHVGSVLRLPLARNLISELNAAAGDKGPPGCRLPLRVQEPALLAAFCLSPDLSPLGRPASSSLSVCTHKLDMLDDLDSLPPVATQCQGSLEGGHGDGMLHALQSLASSTSLEGLDSLPPVEEALPCGSASNDRWPDLRDRFLQRLDIKDRAAMVAGVRRICSACDNGVMDLGTGCSGTDCPVLVTRDLFEIAGCWPSCTCCNCVQAIASSGVKPSIRHVFSCEKDAKKRMWANNEHPVGTVFADIADLGKHMALNVRFPAHAMTPAPGCDAFVVCFSCKLRPFLFVVLCLGCFVYLSMLLTLVHCIVFGNACIGTLGRGRS